MLRERLADLLRDLAQHQRDLREHRENPTYDSFSELEQRAAELVSQVAALEVAVMSLDEAES